MPPCSPGFEQAIGSGLDASDKSSGMCDVGLNNIVTSEEHAPAILIAKILHTLPERQQLVLLQT